MQNTFISFFNDIPQHEPVLQASSTPIMAYCAPGVHKTQATETMILLVNVRQSASHIK